MHQYVYESDYGFDYIRWMRTLGSLKIDSSTPIREKINKLEQDIITTNDSSFAYFFAKEFAPEFNRDISMMQRIIINNEDYKYAYLFAKHIKNANVNELENLIVSSKHILYISKFACFVPGANQNRLQQLVAGFNNPKSSYMMIKYSNSNDLSCFKEVIFQSKKPRYIYELCKKINNPLDIIRGEDLILASESYTYIRLSANNITGSK